MKIEGRLKLIALLINKQLSIIILSGSLIISCLKKRGLRGQLFFALWLDDSWNIYFDSILDSIWSAKDSTIIVSKGVIPPLFLGFPLSRNPRWQDVPTFHRSIEKTKVLNNFCNQFVYNFYPQSILILEEC